MSSSPLEKTIKAKNTPSVHTTAVRMPNETWSTLLELSKKTKLTVNAIMNTAIADLIHRERARLQR